MVWRTVFTVVWLAVEILLALYVGIGFTILLGYLAAITVLVIPLKPKWASSSLVKTVLGRLYTPDTELLLRGLSKSRSYRVTVAVTSVILLAVAMLMIVAFNLRLVELL
jgi:hypothetical protein